MRGLNKSFVESAQKLYERAPAADFSKLFDQYKNHLNSFSVNFKAMDVEEVKKPESGFEPIKSVPFENVKPVVDMPKPFTFKPTKPIEITTIVSDSESSKESEKSEESEKSSNEEVKEESNIIKPFTFEPLKSSEPSTTKPFSFGFSESKSEVNAAVPAFKPFAFGSSTEAKPIESTTPSAPEIKPFTFGGEVKPVATEASETTNVPAFKPFTFGSSATNPTKSISTTFKIGSIEENNKTENVETGTTVKPFSFGSTVTESAKPASVETTNASKPFSFGSSTNETTVKPFSFGSSTTSTEISKPFSFGAPVASIGGLAPLPTFSFGTTNPSTSAAPFSFIVPVAKSENHSGGEDDDEIPAEEAESFTLTRTNNEQLKTGAGEENETTQHEERCKIFMMDPVKNEWIDLSVGIFKINRYNTGSGKSRVLCRSEGSGKVILNTLISVPGTDVTRMEGKKEVAMLAIGPDGKPTKYLIRVKTLEQADALKAALSSEIEYVKANKN